MDMAGFQPPAAAAIGAQHSSSAAAFLAHPLWVGAAISFSAGLALGLIVFLVLRRPIRRLFIKRTHPSKESSTNPTLFTPVICAAHDLLTLCDDHPSRPPLDVIGRGACGEVYKADLLTGEQTITVAIKKILQPSLIEAADLCDQDSKALDHRMRQIKSEIMTVGRMRHPHLVRLLAHVPRPHCHYLVYEYMTNGSLHDALKADEATRRLKLHWPNRLQIVRGIAAGLEYLHMVHRPRIIHRDLKPANILLDRDLNARIADFGLAKIVPEAISGALSSAHVAGTLGYIAPEYYRTLSCTDKSDIYSFGVILAVIVTGMFPSDRFFGTTDEPSLVAWVKRMAIAADPSEAIDRLLLGTGWEAEIVLVLKIACFCTYDDHLARPNSREVRRMLSEIKH